MADGTVTIKINVDGKEVELKLDKIDEKIEAVGDTASGVTEGTQRDLKAVGIALGAISASLMAAGLKAYEYSSQFNAAFAQTQTIMDTNVVTARNMRDAVLELSRDSAMAAEDVSEAVYQAISGSVDTADAVEFVDKANKLAVAGFTSLTNATDVLTTSLNAYHLSADKVNGISNVLIRTQNLGKTSVDELSASMGKAIATGSAYGVDLQNLSTAYVELTRSGINTAESTTYINSMLNELGDSGKTVGKILQEKTGRSFGQLMQDGASLGDVLQILLESVDGNSEAFMGLWGSQEAGKAANAIASQSIQDFNKVLEQMNAEMAGTTGTTEQAYETMTSTSEFIDKRLNNSVKNLAIAYGDVLAPPMDAIKSLGADILEGVTELIQRSPVAASAIAAVSTGVVVLAGGLTALMIVQKVKEAFGGFNALLSSSPLLIAAAGVAALAMGIASLVGSLSDSNNQLDAFNDKLKDIDSSFHTELATVAVASEKADGYISRLEELEAAGLSTTEQQEEYHAILEELVETIPELSALIDLETDTIQGGTKALRENTDAWTKNAREQAYQKYLTALTEAYTDALIDQKTAEIELENNREKKRQQEQKERELLEEIIRLNNEAAEAARAFNEAHGTELTSDTFLDEEKVNAANAALAALREEMDQTNEETEKLQKKFDDAAETVAAAEEPLNLAKQAIDELADSEKNAGNAAEKTGEQFKGTLKDATSISTETKKKITDAMQEWADKYGDLYQAAKTSLEKQFKLWEEVESVTATSVEKANRGIQSQIDYWNNYNDNLQTIKDSGIRGMEELYAYIADGSTDSIAMAAGIADAIRSGNEPAVEEMIQLYRDLQIAQGNTISSMLTMQKDMDAALNDLVESVDDAIGDMNLSDKAWAAAHKTVLSYAQGLYDGKSDAETAASAVVSAAEKVLKGGKKTSGKSVATPYASGTSYADAGLALVGEEGPELIWLRGGERILTSDETREALRGMYPAVDATSYSGAAAPASVGGPAGAHEMTIVVPVQVDGRELARVTARAMGEEMIFSAY